MTPDSYQAAKKKTGIRMADTWCRAIKISKDSDKSYSCGRLAISNEVAERVLRQLRMAEERAEFLKEKLKQGLPPEVSLSVNPETLDIDITWPSKTSVCVKNSGLDTLNGWGVYEMSLPCRPVNVFLHAPHQPWSPESKFFDWFFWRGDFDEQRSFKRLQNYWNPIDQTMLQQALRGVA